MILGFEWLNGDSSSEAEEFPTQGRVSSTQTDEEIARWTSDERLNEAEKALFLLEKGLALQKTSVLASLPHFLKSSRSVSLTTAILAQSHKFDETQMNLLGNSLVACLQQGLIPESDFPAILRVSDSVLDCDSEVTCEVWCSVIIAVTRNIDESLALSSAVPVILRLCGFSRPVFIRKSGAALLCALSAAAPQSFPAVVLEKVKLLTQDTSYEIRKTMCRVLPRLASDLGNGGQLFPLAETLLTDEEIAVKREAVGMLCGIIQSLPCEIISERVVHLLETEVLVTTDEVYRCRLMLGTGQIVSMLTSKHSTVLARVLSAYEFGLRSTEESKINGLTCFCEVAQAVTIDLFESRLRVLYSNLAGDSSERVRKAAVGIFHRTLAFVEGAQEEVRRIAEGFLRDGECRWVAIEHVHEWPSYLHTASTFALLRDILLSTSQWRRQLSVVECTRKLISTELSPALHDSLTPALFSVMKSAGYTLKQHAGKTLLELLRVSFQTGQRQAVTMQLLEEFAQSKQAKDRVMYVEFGLGVAQSSSAALFRKYFLRTVVGMAVDPVATVRMRLAMGLERIKLAVAGEEEAADLFHEAMERLCSDSCVSVSRLALDAQAKMMRSAFLSLLESPERAKEEAARVAFEVGLSEYERTLEARARRKIIEDIAAKTRASYQKDKVGTSKRNSLKIPRSVMATKPRFSFSEDRVESPRASSPKPVKSNPRRPIVKK